MIEFRQKDFSKYTNGKRDEILINDTKYLRVPLELIKCLELGPSESLHNFRHWLKDKVVTENLNAAAEKNITPQSLLVGCDSYVDNFSNLNSYFGVNACTSFFSKFKTPEDFIQAVINKLMTESRQGRGEPKYDSWFKTHSLRFVDIYVPLFRYLSLCLSGQIPEADYSEFWNKGPRYLKTKVEYDLEVGQYSVPYLCNIVARVLYGVEYEEKFKTLFI